MDINFKKKYRTWEFKHSCKGSNHTFFDFVLVFLGGCPWKWCTIYLFLDSLMFKLWKTCVGNIISLLDIILKKCRTWTLKHSYKGLNHNFFDFVLLFWDGCPWNWCMIYSFWLLWCWIYGKSVSRISLMCWE